MESGYNEHICNLVRKLKFRDPVFLFEENASLKSHHVAMALFTF